MELRVLTATLALCVGCSKSSPTTPTPQPTLITVTVHVTATNGGQALPGVAGELGGLSANTNADGGFQVQTQPGTTQRLTLASASIVPRSVLIAVNASRDVSVDAIQTGGFDLAFYRKLVRVTTRPMPFNRFGASARRR